MAKTAETWCTSLCRTLDTLRESSTFSDVIIRADNGHIFRAHTCILAASSSVLKTQLLRSQHYLDIPNISRRMWEVLLQFIYTGTVEMWDVAEIPGIMQAGKQLQLTQLLSVCEDRMKGSAQQDKCAAKEVMFQGKFCGMHNYLSSHYFIQTTNIFTFIAQSWVIPCQVSQWSKC